MIRPYEEYERMIIALQYGNPTEEICGVLVERNGKLEAIQLPNMAQDKERAWSLPVADYSYAKMFWHTHTRPDSLDGFSDPDKHTGRVWEMPMCVYVCHTQKFHYWQPDGFRASIVGRPWSPVVFDCFALVRDAILEFFDVSVPDINRNFAHATRGIEAIEEYWSGAGFEMVHRPAIGRVAVINYGGSKFANHIGLLVTENWMLHQLRGTPSRVELFSEMWQKCTFFYMRHVGIEESIKRKAWQYGVTDKPITPNLDYSRDCRPVPDRIYPFPTNWSVAGAQERGEAR